MSGKWFKTVGTRATAALRPMAARGRPETAGGVGFAEALGSTVPGTPALQRAITTRPTTGTNSRASVSQGRGNFHELNSPPLGRRLAESQMGEERSYDTKFLRELTAGNTAGTSPADAELPRCFQHPEPGFQAGMAIALRASIEIRHTRVIRPIDEIDPFCRHLVDQKVIRHPARLRNDLRSMALLGGIEKGRALVAIQRLPRARADAPERQRHARPGHRLDRQHTASEGRLPSLQQAAAERLGFALRACEHLRAVHVRAVGGIVDPDFRGFRVERAFIHWYFFHCVGGGGLAAIKSALAGRR